MMSARAFTGLAGLALLLSTAAGADEAPAYGNTPEDLQPFRHFVRQPYKRFFIEPMAFNGPGRDRAAPQVSSIKIGVMAPLERSRETYMGRPMLQGVQLALDEINAGGGLHGLPFELVVRNDSGLWGASANELAAFSYQDSVWAVIGSIDAANTHIAIRVALKTEMPVMNVGTTDPTLAETRIPWIFRNMADDRQMAYTIAYYLYHQRGFRRVAILRADNRYGRIGVGEFRAASVRLARPAPLEINYEVGYKTLNPTFEVQMERLRRARPDAVVLWADAEAAGHLVRRMRAAGLQMPVVGCERLVHPLFLEAAGAAAEGTMAVYPYDPEADLPALRTFRRAFRERFGAEPSVYAAHAYDGAHMLAEAIRRAGLNRYRIRDELAAMKRYEGVTGEILMDAAHTDRGPVTMATVREGRFVFNLPRVQTRF